MDRVKQIAAHFKPTGLAALQCQSPDDVVITMAIRSPLCKAKKGGFRDARHVPSLRLQTLFTGPRLELMS
jgi:hypothetical protein